MKRSGFSMIELVFVIVILGVLAAVAVPRFVATRTDAQVATARADAASVMKAIVAKVFADNINVDSAQTKVPAPNDPTKTNLISWGDWIMEVGGLDNSRWAVVNYNGNANMPGIAPVGNIVENGVAKKGNCGTLIYIDLARGMLEFNPNGLMSGGNNATASQGTFCRLLKESYQVSGATGQRSIPLASTGTLEF